MTLSILGAAKAGAALNVPNLPYDPRPDGDVLLAVPDHAIAAVAAARDRAALPEPRARLFVELGEALE